MYESLIVAFLGGSGPKSTAVNFLTDANGIREWAWMDTASARLLRPGMVLKVERVVRFTKVKTTYVNTAKETVALKVPKRQLLLEGAITVEEPAPREPLEQVVTITPEAVAYGQRYDVAHADDVADDAAESAETDEAF
jgi:hypothetical protein